MSALIPALSMAETLRSRVEGGIDIVLSLRMQDTADRSHEVKNTVKLGIYPILGPDTASHEFKSVGTTRLVFGTNTFSLAEGFFASRWESEIDFIAYNITLYFPNTIMEVILKSLGFNSFTWLNENSDYGLIVKGSYTLWSGLNNPMLNLMNNDDGRLFGTAAGLGTSFILFISTTYL